MLSPFYQNKFIEAGCDEAGRGCLAGPVFAAAVILPSNFHHPLLNDSKQVTEANRNELRQYIEANAIAFGVASIDNVIIDNINILKASFKAVHKALDKLKPKPGFILMDGNRFVPYNKIPHQCIIKGDALYQSIAAASILAKTYRDEYMLQLHQQFPFYGWDKNKGYGTALHRQAIHTHGQCLYHRKSFKLKQTQTKLF
ncbi:MAG: hypothetical protein RIR12_455 [Bacteroidota bacterium]|jgi:ribonuclease HII